MKRTRIRDCFRAAALGAAAVVTVLAGSPTATAEATLQVSESSGLSAGQTITVTLAGLPPNLPTVAVGQCKPQITLPTDCNLSGSRMGKSDAQGVWQPNNGDTTIVLVDSVGGTNCLSAPGACTVAVTSLTDASNILASVPLTFGPKETTKPPAGQNDSQASDTSDDSNTAVVVGIVAAVVVIAIVAAVIVLRRRGGRA